MICPTGVGAGVDEPAGERTELVELVLLRTALSIILLSEITTYNLNLHFLSRGVNNKHIYLYLRHFARASSFMIRNKLPALGEKKRHETQKFVQCDRNVYFLNRYAGMVIIEIQIMYDDI